MLDEDRWQQLLHKLCSSQTLSNSAAVVLQYNIELDYPYIIYVITPQFLLINFLCLEDSDMYYYYGNIIRTKENI